jgi:hypothetical protein
MKNFVEIKESKFGKGLFAKTNINAGTTICRINLSDEFDLSKTFQLKSKESHALQIDHDRYVMCPVPFLYANHSCNPNCGVTPEFEMVCIKDIGKGEELFWDYSTSMLERAWTMKCECGDKYCRKIVTDFDLLPQKVQSRYLQLNIVLPFISQYLQQQLAKTG